MNTTYKIGQTIKGYAVGTGILRVATINFITTSDNDVYYSYGKSLNEMFKYGSFLESDIVGVVDANEVYNFALSYFSEDEKYEILSAIESGRKDKAISILAEYLTINKDIAEEVMILIKNNDAFNNIHGFNLPTHYININGSKISINLSSNEVATIKKLEENAKKVKDISFNVEKIVNDKLVYGVIQNKKILFSLKVSDIFLDDIKENDNITNDLIPELTIKIYTDYKAAQMAAYNKIIYEK